MHQLIDSLGTVQSAWGESAIDFIVDIAVFNIYFTDNFNHLPHFKIIIFLFLNVGEYLFFLKVEFKVQWFNNNKKLKFKFNSIIFMI